MRIRTRSALAGLAVVSALVLAGCTADDGNEGGGSAPQSSSEATGPGTATVADQVMAEQTVDASGDAGGTMTVTLRSVEVRDGVTTVRWALQWDSESADEDEVAGYSELGIDWSRTVTDTAGLVVYKPFCTEGSWQDGAAEQIKCSFSATSSPGRTFSGFVNHATVEGWATFPAPEGKPTTVDVSLGEGLPSFTGATVTYAEAE